MVGVTTQRAFTVSNPYRCREDSWRVERGAKAPGLHDITPDGKRFIGMIVAGQNPSGAPVTPQIHVVLNWTEELKAVYS